MGKGVMLMRYKLHKYKKHWMWGFEGWVVGRCRPRVVGPGRKEEGFSTKSFNSLFHLTPSYSPYLLHPLRLHAFFSIPPTFSILFNSYHFPRLPPKASSFSIFLVSLTNILLLFPSHLSALVIHFQVYSFLLISPPLLPLPLIPGCLSERKSVEASETRRYIPPQALPPKFLNMWNSNRWNIYRTSSKMLTVAIEKYLFSFLHLN